MKTPFFEKSLKRFLCLAVIFLFFINTLGPVPSAQAQEFHLPVPGVMVHLSPPLDPPILKGIKVDPNNPFKFDFILDQGDNSIPPGELKQEATRLIKYFLASLTVPEKDLWVNLSPYEKDRIVPGSFGKTEMGRDLLAEDYMLKQITASLIYPEDQIGKKFWKRVYEEAAKKYGTTNIPVNTFNKVWIVPEKAVVYENAKAGTAYVVESKLKVMLEQDYLALEKNQRQPGDMFKSELQGTCPQAGCQASKPLNMKAPEGTKYTQNINALGSQIVREIVIPELTKEINEDKNFVKLRQVYNSLILAAWYKKKIKDSILEQVYADKNKTAGVGYSKSIILSAAKDLKTPLDSSASPQNDIERIYQRYLQAFKKGVYNYIKEEQDPITQEMIPRKYFSGGFNLAMTSLGTDSAMVIKEISADSTIFDQAGTRDMALVAVSMKSADEGVISGANEGTLTSNDKFTALLDNFLNVRDVELHERIAGSLSMHPGVVMREVLPYVQGWREEMEGFNNELKDARQRRSAGSPRARELQELIGRSGKTGSLITALFEIQNQIWKLERNTISLLVNRRALKELYQKKEEMKARIADLEKEDKIRKEQGWEVYEREKEIERSLQERLSLLSLILDLQGNLPHDIFLQAFSENKQAVYELMISMINQASDRENNFIVLSPGRLMKIGEIIRALGEDFDGLLMARWEQAIGKSRTYYYDDTSERNLGNVLSGIGRPVVGSLLKLYTEDSRTRNGKALTILKILSAMKKGEASEATEVLLKQRENSRDFNTDYDVQKVVEQAGNVNPELIAPIIQRIQSLGYTNSYVPARELDLWVLSQVENLPEEFTDILLERIRQVLPDYDPYFELKALPKTKKVIAKVIPVLFDHFAKNGRNYSSGWEYLKSIDLENAPLYAGYLLNYKPQGRNVEDYNLLISQLDDYWFNHGLDENTAEILMKSPHAKSFYRALLRTSFATRVIMDALGKGTALNVPKNFHKRLLELCADAILESDSPTVRYAIAKAMSELSFSSIEIYQRVVPALLNSAFSSSHRGYVSVDAEFNIAMTKIGQLYPQYTVSELLKRYNASNFHTARNTERELFFDILGRIRSSYAEKFLLDFIEKEDKRSVLYPMAVIALINVNLTKALPISQSYIKDSSVPANERQLVIKEFLKINTPMLVNFLVDAVSDVNLETSLRIAALSNLSYMRQLLVVGKIARNENEFEVPKALRFEAILSWLRRTNSDEAVTLAGSLIEKGDLTDFQGRNLIDSLVVASNYHNEKAELIIGNIAQHHPNMSWRLLALTHWKDTQKAVGILEPLATNEGQNQLRALEILGQKRSFEVRQAIGRIANSGFEQEKPPIPKPRLKAGIQLKAIEFWSGDNPVESIALLESIVKSEGKSHFYADDELTKAIEQINQINKPEAQAALGRIVRSDIRLTARIYAAERWYDYESVLFLLNNLNNNFEWVLGALNSLWRGLPQLFVLNPLLTQDFKDHLDFFIAANALSLNDPFRLLTRIEKPQLQKLSETIGKWKGKEDQINTLVMTLQSSPEFFNFLREILISGVPNYLNTFDALMNSPGSAQETGLSDFIFDSNIRLGIRMDMIEHFIEILAVQDLTRYGQNMGELKTAIQTAKDALNEVMIKKESTKSMLERPKRITRDFRKKWLQFILGRELKDKELELFQNKDIEKKILNLLSLSATLGSKTNDDGPLIRTLVADFLNKLFIFYASVASIKDPKVRMEKLVAWGNQFILGIDQAKTGRSNTDIIEELVKAGYSRELWTHGVDFETNVSEGITEEGKRETIRQASYEMVETAIAIGVKEVNGEAISLEKAKEIDSYSKAKVFYDGLNVSHLKSIVPENQLNLLGHLEQILLFIEAKENELVLDHHIEARFRVTIKKDVFAESSAGIGVPGCFAPNGVGSQMPLYHSMEANAGFIQVYNSDNKQIANAVIVYTTEGAYVYSIYNSSAYKMDYVFGKALTELTRYVPRIIVGQTSAGYDYLSKFGSRSGQDITIVKPATVFRAQYYDSGTVDENGQLTLHVANPLVVTQADVRAKGGFDIVEEKKAVETSSKLTLELQGLFDKFRAESNDQVNFTKFSFIINPLKNKLAQEGRFRVDDEYYLWVDEMIRSRPQYADVDEDVTLQVADLIADYLEEQNWPMEILTPIAPMDAAMTGSFSQTQVPLTEWVDQLPQHLAKGGIDLTSDKTLTIQSNGEEGIKFHIDPAQLAGLKNASGFVPIIINIKPMTDLRRFMGLEEVSMPHS